MSTAVGKPPTGGTHQHWNWFHANSPKRWRELTVVLLLVLAGLLVFAVVQRQSSGQQTATTPSSSSPNAAFWLATVEVGILQRDLQDAGYALPLTGRLDALTRSAAADYLRGRDLQELPLGIGLALQDTVITGRRDPARWNARFGADRVTRQVERPLTGPGGQLDDYGNIRQP